MANKRASLTDSIKHEDVWRLQKQLEELRDHLQERGLLAKDTVASKLQDIGETLHHYYDEGRERMEEAEDEVADFVRARPFQAMLAAIGIGFLLSLLLRRR